MKLVWNRLAAQFFSAIVGNALAQDAPKPEKLSGTRFPTRLAD